MVGIVDEIDGLGAMADAVAPKLSFGKFWIPLRLRLRKIARNCDSPIEKDVHFSTLKKVEFYGCYKLKEKVNDILVKKV